jgi:fatty-acyl-CoA synthase
MHDFPLTLPHFFERAERLFADKEVVTVTATGRERVTYGTWAERARRLGGVLEALGVSADGRVATFAWNTARHLELYFAAPCTGRVLHTLNIRLSPEQLVYIVNHAEDEVIFVDRSLARLLVPPPGCPPSGWGCCPSSTDVIPAACAASCAAVRRFPERCPRRTSPASVFPSSRPGA